MRRPHHLFWINIVVLVVSSAALLLFFIGRSTMDLFCQRASSTVASLSCEFLKPPGTSKGKCIICMYKQLFINNIIIYMLLTPKNRI